jgi:hypothetical protein
MKELGGNQIIKVITNYVLKSRITLFGTWFKGFIFSLLFPVFGIHTIGVSKSSLLIHLKERLNLTTIIFVIRISSMYL